MKNKINNEHSTFFNSEDKELKKGSLVIYQGKRYLLWNINPSNKAQLISSDFKKFSGTPSVDKLQSIGSYVTTKYNNTEYIVTSKGNIFSGASGKLVFTGEDDSSKAQKLKIIASCKTKKLSKGFTM